MRKGAKELEELMLQFPTEGTVERGVFSNLITEALRNEKIPTLDMFGGKQAKEKFFKRYPLRLDTLAEDIFSEGTFERLEFESPIPPEPSKKSKSARSRKYSELERSRMGMKEYGLFEHLDFNKLPQPSPDPRGKLMFLLRRDDIKDYSFSKKVIKGKLSIAFRADYLRKRYIQYPGGLRLGIVGSKEVYTLGGLRGFDKIFVSKENAQLDILLERKSFKSNRGILAYLSEEMNVPSF
jgi:hypothetical protein